MVHINRAMALGVFIAAALGAFPLATQITCSEWDICSAGGSMDGSGGMVFADASASTQDSGGFANASASGSMLFYTPGSPRLGYAVYSAQCYSDYGYPGGASAAVGIDGVGGAGCSGINDYSFGGTVPFMLGEFFGIGMSASGSGGSFPSPGGGSAAAWFSLAVFDASGEQVAIYPAPEPVGMGIAGLLLIGAAIWRRTTRNR